MSDLLDPATYGNPTRREFFRNLGFPYIEPSFGKHAGDWTAEELIRQREQYQQTAPAIPAGFGKHRAARYPNSSYNVVEDGQRDQLKAARLTRRAA